MHLNLVSLSPIRLVATKNSRALCHILRIDEGETDFPKTYENEKVCHFSTTDSDFSTQILSFTEERFSNRL